MDPPLFQLSVKPVKEQTGRLRLHQKRAVMDIGDLHRPSENQKIGQHGDAEDNAVDAEGRELVVSHIFHQTLNHQQAHHPEALRSEA